ncbi:MAG: cytochrome c maturation protein CcmE [bacterium]
MNPVRKKRLYLILAIVLGVGAATALVLQAFQQNMMFYYSPSEIKEGKAPTNHPVRIGGMVVENSVQRSDGDLTVDFELTDYAENVHVSYTGILPDLFREGQGIIGRGMIQPDGSIVAEEILAKHDENYMPPEVADSLKAKKDGVATK